MSILAAIAGFVAANGGPIAVTVVAGQIIGRAIPDDKRGFLGVVRRIAKAIGLYATPDLDHVHRQAAQNSAAIAELPRKPFGKSRG